MKRLIAGFLFLLFGAYAQASTFYCSWEANIANNWVSAQTCLSQATTITTTDDNGSPAFDVTHGCGNIVDLDVGWGANPASPFGLSLYWKYQNSCLGSNKPVWVRLGYCAVGPAGGSQNPTNDLSCNTGTFPVGPSPYASPVGSLEQSNVMSGATGNFTDSHYFYAPSSTVYLEADGLSVDANDYTNVTGLTTTPSLGTASCANGTCTLSSTSATVGPYKYSITGTTVGTVTAHSYVLQTPAPSSWISWTPTVSFGATAATVTLTDCKYQTNGNWVYGECVVTISSKNGGTGSINMSLPSGTAYTHGGGSGFTSGGVAVATDPDGAVAYLLKDNATHWMADTDFNVGDSVKFSVEYFQ